MSTAARSSAKAPVSSAGVSAAANGSVVARVNIASKSAGLSRAKPMKASATRARASRPSVAPPRAVRSAFCEFAESLDGDRRGDVFHAREVFVEHRLAVLDLGRQPAGGDGLPTVFLGELARRRR